MKKRLLSWFLVLTMITSLIPSTLITSAFAAGSTDIDGITQDVPFVAGQAELTLSGSGKYVLQGTQNGRVIKITNRAKVTLLLKNVEMDSPTSPIQVESGAELTLVVADDSTNTIGCTATAVTVDGADPNNGMTAGIYVPDGAKLNIDTPTNGTGTGKLTVTGGYGGAGIGGKAGTGIDATGTRAPSGVSGKRGSFQGNALDSEGKGGDGGLGGHPGNVGGSAGTIVLKSGTISATGGYGGAGIGGGMGATGEIGEQGKKGNIGISGYLVGGNRTRGYDFANNWFSVVYSSGGTGGSGQGGAGGTGGKGGSGGAVTIENATVTAKGNNGGADVGGGAGGIGGRGGPGGERNEATAPVNKLTARQATNNTHDGAGQTGIPGYGGKGATGAHGRGGAGGDGTVLTILGGSLTRINRNSVAQRGIDDPTELSEVDQSETGGSGGPASMWTYEYIYNNASPNPTEGDVHARIWYADITYQGGKAGGAGGTGGEQAAVQRDGTAGTIVIDRSAEGNATTDFVASNVLNAGVRPVDAKGNALYLYTLTVTELDNATQVSGAKVTVKNVASASDSTTYIYYAVTNAEGKAQLWLPQGTYTLKGKDVYSETKGWIPSSKSKTFTVNETDGGAEQVAIGPDFTLTASTNDKVYFSGNDKPVTLTVDATSITNNITTVQWFAEPIAGTVNQYDTAADTVNNISNFDDGYTAANAKGNAGTENVTDDKHTFEIPINENGRYWVKVTYKTGSGTTSTSVVNPITVTNIYRKFPLLVNSYVSVKNVHTGKTGYGPLKTAGDEVYNGSYGFAWDLNGYNADALDGSKLLDATVAAYDTVPLVPRSTYATWYNAELLADSKTKFELNESTVGGYKPITLTLNKDFLDENLNTKCDTIKSKKDFSKYTIVYTPRDGALTAVTVSGVDKAATDGSTLYSSQISYTEAITQDTLTAHRIKGYKLTGAKIIYADSPEKDVTPTMQADGSYAVSLTNIQGTAEQQYKDRVSEVRFIYEDNMTDITIKAYYVGTTTPVDGFTEYTTPMEVGTKVTYSAPVINGFKNDGSTLVDNAYEVVENGEIIFYYYKQTGNVTYKAVLDGTTEVIWQESGTVEKGNAPTDVLPTGADFKAMYDRKSGDTAVITDSDGAPATVYDGIHSLTVTYTYVHKTRAVTIKQVDANTGAEIKTTKQEDNAIGTYATVAAPALPSGYTLIGASEQKIYIAPTGDLEVTFYYKASEMATITIKLYASTADKTAGNAFNTMTVSGVYGVKQTVSAPKVLGWELAANEKTPVELTPEKNKPASLIAEFVYDAVYDDITVTLTGVATGDLPADWTNGSKTFQVQQGQGFTITAPSIVNYKLADSETLEKSLNAEQIKTTKTITFNYVKAEADLITITVEGVVDGVATPLYSYTKNVRMSATDVEVQIFTLNGYKLDSVKMGTNTTITATDGVYKINPQGTAQTVTATYSDNMVDVTINGYLKGTTTNLFDSFTVKAEAGKAFTYAQPSLIGYDTVTPINNTIDAVKTGDSITFYYQKSSGNVTYKAVADGKNLAVKTVTVDKDGEIVKSTDKANKLFTIPYYQVKGEGVVTTNAADKTKYDGVNDVTVTYTYEKIKKAVKIEKYDQATGLKIDGEDQTTPALAAGETHNVTLTDVEGYTSLDSSISIFVDGTDGQTVKAYYKQSDEVFITVKQMCGGVLLNSYKVPAQYGVKQEIKAPDMPGYTKPTGTFEATPVKGNDASMVVTLEYTLDAWEVAVKLIDAAGKDITPAGFEKTYQVKKGDGFTIAAPNVNGYRLSGNTLVVSRSADALNTEANRTITFTYDKIEDVIGDYQAKVTIKAQYNGYALADDRTQVVTKGKDATVVPDTFEGYVVSQYKLGENGTLNDAKNGVTVNVTENIDLYLIYTRPDNSVVLPGKNDKIGDSDDIIVKPTDPNTPPTLNPGPNPVKGSVTIPDNTTGTVTRPTNPDQPDKGKEDIIVPGGSVVKPDGTIVLPNPDGGEIGPNDKIPENLPNGYVAITYDSNNSNQEVKKEIGKKGELKVSGSLFTDPSNRSFAGWNDSGSGNGKTYAKDTTVSANLTLYAVWDAQYRYSTNIIYKANDGSTNQDTQLVGHATDPVLKGKLQNSPFQVSGWTFGGWNEAANGSGTLYQPGDVLTLTNQVNKTLFAQWFKTNADDSITVPGSDGNPNNPDTNATGNGNGTDKPSRNDKGEIEIPKGGSVTLPGGSVIGMPDGGKLLPDGTIIINRPDTNKDGKSDGTITIPGKDGTNPDVTDKDGKPENKKVFTLIYDINNGEDDEVLVKVVEGDAVSTIKNPFTWAGHIFLNWMREAGAKEYPAEATVENVTDREIFHAQWAKVNPDGSIELPGKDGILDGTDTATGTDHSKDNVTVTPADPDNGGKLTPQPDGSVKVEDSNGGTVNRPKDSTDLDAGREDIKVPNGTVVKPDGTIILPDNGSTINPGDKLPGATPDGYVSVVYKANGGTGDDVIVVVKSTETINTIKNPFKKNGETFTGWNTAENGINGTAYGEGAEITGITGKSVTLYAQWTKSTAFKYSAKLIYLPNDGTREANKIEDTVGANDSQTFSENLRAANTFTVTGWTFGGWNTAANGSGDLKAANAVIEVTANVNQTFHAQWYKANADGSITVPGKDGNPNTAGDNVTANGNGNPVTRDDATGNIEIPAGGSVITPNGEIALPDGGILKPDGTVIINLPDTNNNGKPDNTITVPGANGTDPDVKDENGNTDNTKTAVVLTYQANNGSGKEVKVYTVSGKATQALAKDAFTYSGHKFLYWQSGDKTYQAAAEITPNGDMTLSAVWAKVNPDGSIELPGENGKLEAPHDKDNVIVTPDNKDGLEGPKDDGSVEVKPDHEATVTRPDPDPTKPDTKEDVKVPAGTVILPDGTIKLPAPDNTEIKPGDKIPETTTAYVTVTFEAGTGTGSTIKQIVNKNSKINLLDESAFTAPDNHFFVGWKDADGKSYDAGVEYDVGTAAVTFTAQYQDRDNLTKAVAIFDYAGGTDINGNGSKYVTGKADAAITGIADPTRTGYTFAGWGNADLKFGASGSVTEFTAQWTIKSYNVTFDVGDDTKGTMSGYTAPVKVEYGKSVASADIPSIAAIAGNVFVGWLNSSDNSVYTADSLKNYVVTGNVTFTAQYVDASLATVIFVYAGGTLNGEHSKLVSATEGSAIGTLPEPTRDGYTLTGWTPIIADNATFGAAGTVTVYTAQWDENEKQPFTVTFEIDNTKGSTADDTTETVADGGFVTKVPTVTAKAGYRFVGWKDQDNKLFYEAGLLLYPITKNTTFTAQFEEVTANPGTATVIFDANGGKIGNNSVLTKVGVPGAQVENIANPVRAGYTFVSWLDEQGDAVDAANIVYGAADTTATYTAKWEAIEYTIHFSATGASGATADQTYKFDGTTKNSLNRNGFTLAGKDFIGWSLTDGATTADFADGALINDTLRAALATSNGSITLYAVWADGVTNTLTVTGSKATAKRDETVDFTAYLNGVATNAVTWIVTGGQSGTDIDANGVLMIGSNESNGTVLTVTAIYKNDTSLTASATVRVVVNSNNNGGNNGGGTVSSSFVIKASAGNGGIISPSGNVSVKRGDDQTFVINPVNGYRIADVIVDGKSVDAVSLYTFENVRANHTIEVVFTKLNSIVADPTETGVAGWLQTREHIAYLGGYGNGLFGPNDNMTRAQVAQMFYNLLLEKDIPVTTSFSDVPADAWYAKAVNTLASLGIIKGIGNDQFAPNRTITRAEFTVIAMRFANVSATVTNPFSDIASSDWYYTAVTSAVSYGWITGYSDGTFKPQATITRAEVATIVNRMLARTADRNFVDSSAVTRFDDVPATYWAYYNIAEATTAHTHTIDNDGVESWGRLM